MTDINTTDKIYGGFFQVARQLFSSEIWKEKPSSWKVIWVYILGKVNHKKNGKFDRGEGFFNFSEERRQIGIDITANMIKRFCQYALRSSMISTKRSTRGMMLKVINYDKYQTFSNFISTTKSTSKAREKHEPSTPINNNDKNENNDNNIYSNLKDYFEKEITLPTNDRSSLFLYEKDKFIDYWTEKSSAGKKERWQLEKVFDIKKRWKRWIRNMEARQRPKEYKKEIRSGASFGGMMPISKQIDEINKAIYE